MGMGLALLLLAASGSVAPTAHSKQDDRVAITIRFRFPGAICAGLCPNFETQVDQDGNVTAQSLWPEGKTTHFKVKEKDFLSFYFLVSELRYLQHPQLDAACERPISGDSNLDQLYDPKPDDIEMTLTDWQGTVRVTGCASNQLLEFSLHGALEVLGVDPYSGEKLKG
jgi:hypothetical protein